MKITVIPALRGREGYLDSWASFQDADEVLPSLDDIIGERREQVNCVNAATQRATGDVLVFMAERQRFVVDWRKILEEEVTKMKSGLLSFYIDAYAGFAVTRDFLENELKGFIYWPDYIHYWSDDELGHRAKRANKHYVRRGMIEEDIRPKTDQISREFYARDRAMFERRQALGFPDELLVQPEEKLAEIKNNADFKVVTSGTVYPFP